MGLPWRLLRERLAPPDPDYVATCVHYNKTLELLDSDSMVYIHSLIYLMPPSRVIHPMYHPLFSQKSHPGSTSVAESLYRNKTSLEAIFRILDKDNSGQISLEEFEEACNLLHKHLPEHTTEDLLQMCKMMDINKDGLVDLNEFLEAFRLCDQARRGARGRALIIGESLSLEKTGASLTTVEKPRKSVSPTHLTESGTQMVNGVKVTTSVTNDDDPKNGSEDEEEEEEDFDVDGGGSNVIVVERNEALDVDGDDDGEQVCLTKKKNGSCNGLSDKTSLVGLTKSNSAKSSKDKQIPN